MPTVQNTTYTISGELAPELYAELSREFRISKYATEPNKYDKIYPQKVTIKQLYDAIADALDMRALELRCLTHHDKERIQAVQKMSRLSYWVYCNFVFGEYKEMNPNTRGVERQFHGLWVYGEAAPEKLSIFKKHLTKNRPDVAKFLAENKTFYLWHSPAPIRTICFLDYDVISDKKPIYNPTLSCGQPLYLYKQ
jgi:hypothetical protein